MNVAGDNPSLETTHNGPALRNQHGDSSCRCNMFRQRTSRLRVPEPGTLTLLATGAVSYWPTPGVNEGSCGKMKPQARGGTQGNMISLRPLRYRFFVGEVA